MKTTKLTDEQKEQLSIADVAHIVLTENGKKMTIQDLFKKVIKLMELPDSYFESKIADFFSLLSTDKRFIMLEKGYWDLRINHSSKISLDDEEEEEILPVDEEEEIDDEEEETIDEINYDDDSVDDDDDEDDLKDLVILDDNDDSEMM